MGYVLVGCGGTGQHMVLAAARLKVLRALPPDLTAYVIDAERDTTLSDKVTKTYATILGTEQPVMPYSATTQVKDPSFQDLFVDKNNGLEEEVFNAFFDGAEAKDTKVAEGMFGQPSVGSTIITLGSATDGVKNLITKLRSENEGVFLCGSIVGGTGAGIMHKLAKRLENKDRTYGIFFGRWFTPPKEATVNDAKQLRNLAHGLDYIYNHTIGCLNCMAIIGGPDNVAGSKVAVLPDVDPSGGETISYYMLAGAWALLSLRDTANKNNDRSIYAFGHDVHTEGWLLDAPWHGGKTLRSRYEVSKATAILLKFLSTDNFLKKAMNPGLFGARGKTLIGELHTSLENHLSGKKSDHATAVEGGLRKHVALHQDFATAWLEAIYGEDILMPSAVLQSLLGDFDQTSRGKNDNMVQWVKAIFTSVIEIKEKRLDAPSLSDEIAKQVIAYFDDRADASGLQRK